MNTYTTSWNDFLPTLEEGKEYWFSFICFGKTQLRAKYPPFKVKLISRPKIQTQYSDFKYWDIRSLKWDFSNNKKYNESRIWDWNHGGVFSDTEEEAIEIYNKRLDDLAKSLSLNPKKYNLVEIRKSIREHKIK